MKPDWRQSCVRLWGEDWVTPLADVLGVDRKTVTRWKMGGTPIPAAVEADLVGLGPFDDGSDEVHRVARAYGDFLRRRAKGATIKDIEDWITLQQEALGTLEADIGAFHSIPALMRDRQP